MTGVALDLVDAGDLVGALAFVADWLASDPVGLEPSLNRFASDHYQLSDLHGDLVRLAAVLTQARSVAIDGLGGPR